MTRSNGIHFIQHNVTKVGTVGVKLITLLHKEKVKTACEEDCTLLTEQTNRFRLSEILQIKCEV